MHRGWPSALSTLLPQLPASRASASREGQHGAPTFQGAQGVLGLRVAGLLRGAVALGPLAQRVVHKCLHHAHQRFPVLPQHLDMCLGVTFRSEAAASGASPEQRLVKGSIISSLFSVLLQWVIHLQVSQACRDST